MLMLHPDTQNIGDAKKYARGWKILEQDNIETVANAILKHAVSPICWSDGVRRSSNFSHSEWLILDVDDGPSIAQAIREFSLYRCIIATTKSHGIKGTSDRYRVFVPFCGEIDDPYTYRATVKSYISEFGADRACSDLARMFWPCKSIAHLNRTGFSADLVDSSEEIMYEKKKSAEELRAIEKLRSEHANGSFPGWVYLALEHGCPGKVNTTCYKIGIALATIGYRCEEIVEIIVQSSLPNRSAGLSEEELRKEINLAVQNGCKTAQVSLEALGLQNSPLDSTP